MDEGIGLPLRITVRIAGMPPKQTSGQLLIARPYSRTEPNLSQRIPDSSHGSKKDGGYQHVSLPIL